MPFEQNIAWIKPSKYINSCSKSVISSSFNMHTTHSVLQHYNHQVKYWWWFFAPTFYALVFFTKSLHHVYYNTQLFANKHISCVSFLLCSPSGGISLLHLLFQNSQTSKSLVNRLQYKYFKDQHIQEFRSFCLHQILLYYYLKPYPKWFFFLYYGKLCF